MVKYYTQFIQISGNLSVVYRAATANLSQARPNILPQIILTSCIETQNLGKALGALLAVAALDFIIKYIKTDKPF